MINEFNALLTLDIQFFATDGEPQDADSAIEANRDEQPSGETKVNSSDEPTTDEKTFTQAQLDELIAKRIERERKKYEKYSDYDELKTKLSEYEKQAEEKRLSELSEVEKAQEQAKQFEAKVQELTAQLEAERTKAQQQAIKNEFIKVASSANIIDIDAAIALSDLSAVEIGEDGKVNGIDDVVKTLVENKPYLVAKKQAQPIGQATNISGGQTDKTAEQLLADAAEKARRTGTLADKVAYAQLKKQLSK